MIIRFKRKGSEGTPGWEKAPHLVATACSYIKESPEIKLTPAEHSELVLSPENTAWTKNTLTHSNPSISSLRLVDHSMFLRCHSHMQSDVQLQDLNQYHQTNNKTSTKCTRAVRDLSLHHYVSYALPFRAICFIYTLFSL